MSSHRDNDLAMVFPGQGSQSVGMLADLAQRFSEVEATFAQASEVLGYDLWQMVQSGEPETLNKTVHTQPAMLAAGVATWRCWQAAGGGQALAMAGHSLGEYTALVCAQALSFEDAVQLVRARGQLMQDALPEGRGAMAAILGLDDQAVVSVCAQAEDAGIVSAANFNSPGQVVIAGERDAVQRAMELAKQAGAKRALLLPVSVPSHCQLMRGAAEAFAERLAQLPIETPVVPVIHNADVLTHENADAIRNALAIQLHSPVRWVDSVQALAARGARTLLEMGPGKVLANLVKRIDKKLEAIAVQTPQDLEQALAATGQQAAQRGEQV